MRMVDLAGPGIHPRPTLPAAGRHRYTSRAGVAPAVVLLLLAGCFGGGGGQPPQPPEPPWVCPIPAPWCDEVGQQCSTPESPCVHNPTDDPEHCELAADCAEPPPPEPPPEPPPGGCVDEPALVATTCFAEEFRNEVKKATDALGDLTGGDPQKNLVKVAEQLRTQMPGRCVIAGIEAVFIVRDDGKYEENHTVFFGTGGWTGSGYGKYIGCHYAVGGPPPVPPPSGECPAPHPDLARMKFKSTEHNGNLDTSWVTVDQEPYCREIGMSPMADGTLRAGCPVRPEGGEGSEERAPCEAELCDQKWECNGQPYPPYKGNAAQSNCRGHWKTWCSAEGSTAVLEGDR